jgi:RNA polymerase sigma-70 factor, ECF subfamily
VDEQIARWAGHSVGTDVGCESVPAAKIGLSKMSDVELMAVLRDGQSEALAVLFDRFHRLILNLAARIVRDRTEAEDLMQEVFFEVFRTVGRFDPVKGSVKSWIVQVTYHKSLNRRKYLALRGAFEDREIKEFDPAQWPAHSRRAKGRSSEDTLEAVLKGLAMLSPKQREVIELVCFKGFLLREVAERSGDSLGNVRHHYYRGIQRLREFIHGRPCSPSEIPRGTKEWTNE